MIETLTTLISDALHSARESGELAVEVIPEPHLERPRDLAHGDWATNVAMQLARPAGMNPRVIADSIAKRIQAHPDIDQVEVAGPGFINIRLSPAALQRILVEAREAGRDFGRLHTGGGERVQLEFVSANPVGPMHVGHGRWAALGDAMARVLEHAGYAVEREFYVNDAGVQMDIFAASVSARYLELCGVEAEFPEDGYRGAYIVEIAQEILDEEGDVWASAPVQEREHHFREKAYREVLQHVERVLHGMGVDFDVWFSERTLHEPGTHGVTPIEAALGTLREGGHLYESEGALWFRSTAFGDDKDRVLKKADGDYTYFAADIAYHKDKFDRGFDRVINIWGADHHGYIKRMEAAVAALGHPGKLTVVIGQLVNLFRGGEAVRMSKRTGEMVTFEELLEDVGVDAARYFFLRRSTDQALDFDIELAKSQSSENPVYYVQYAHARICAILRKGAGAQTADTDVDIQAVSRELIPADAPLHLLDGPAELALMRKLAEFEEIVEIAARQLSPFKLTHYAEDLASAFHQFYTVCRVVDPDEPDLSAARLYAVDATRIALATVLGLVGVSAPERM